MRTIATPSWRRSSRIDTGSEPILRAMRRLSTTLMSTVVLLALLAPVALAQSEGGSDYGEGLYGETNDVVITNAGFILIAFFPLFIFVMSILQWRLEKRKDRRKHAEKARAANADVRGGW
jgi:hypothetical protein